MKKICIILTLSLFALLVFSSCETPYMYSEEDVIGLTIAEIEEKYGYVDIIAGMKTDQYRDCYVFYRVYSGFFFQPDREKELFSIHFDENGFADDAYYTRDFD